MISPDTTISDHRLRWAENGMRLTAPMLVYTSVQMLHTRTHTLNMVHGWFPFWTRGRGIQVLGVCQILVQRLGWLSNLLGTTGQD